MLPPASLPHSQLVKPAKNSQSVLSPLKDFHQQGGSKKFHQDFTPFILMLTTAAVVATERHGIYNALQTGFPAD